MLPGNHPESFNLRFFFFFFFFAARDPGDVGTDVTIRPVAIYVLRCVCDSASSSERERTASETGGAVPEEVSHDGPGHGAVRSVEHVEPPPKVASTCTFQSCF